MKDLPISPRLKEIKRKRRMLAIRMVILFCILFASIIYALAFFSSDKKVVIKDILINGTNIINWGEVESAVRDELSGKYLYMFDKRNAFIFPKEKIEKVLLTKFPRIESVDISLKGSTAIILNIKERSGTYLYCGEVVPIVPVDVGENCYFVNEDGYIFDKAPYFSGDVFFKYYLPLVSSGNPKGEYIMDKGLFGNINRFVANIKTLGLSPIYLVIDQDGLYSLYLDHKEGAVLPKILFRDTEKLDIMFENFSIAMSKKEFANEIKTKYDKLLYIDLRFKNKVLYNFEE